MQNVAVDPSDFHRREALEQFALPLAAAQVYFHVMGIPPDRITGPRPLEEILNDVAHALLITVRIYARDGLVLREIAQTELLEATITRGAMALRLKDGTELDRLTVRRADIRAAIAILKGAKVRFSNQA
jgi:hypothetical protein